MKRLSRAAGSLLSCTESPLNYKTLDILSDSLNLWIGCQAFSFTFPLTKFSTVFGTFSPKRPITILPPLPPSISTSKNTLLVMVWLQPCSAVSCEKGVRCTRRANRMPSDSNQAKSSYPLTNAKSVNNKQIEVDRTFILILLELDCTVQLFFVVQRV